MTPHEKKLNQVKPLEKIVIKKKKVVSLSSLKAKAQKVFNEFIRLRDRDKPCITCGKYLIQHACHFYSAGHFTNLRFNELNCHGGCLRCNYFLHGNSNEYRKNIVNRIGEKNLLLLDTMKGSKKYSRFELEIIHQEYSQKVKQLKTAF